MATNVETRPSAPIASTSLADAADVNGRLRALRTRSSGSGQHRYGGVPTGWGRWPTCPCPRETRSADGSCC